jgi:hypothetical protein
LLVIMSQNSSKLSRPSLSASTPWIRAVYMSSLRWAPLGTRTAVCPEDRSAGRLVLTWPTPGSCPVLGGLPR